MKVGDFENVICILFLFQYVKDFYIFDKLFFVDMCIKGVLDLLRKFDLEEVKIRFLMVYS